MAAPKGCLVVTTKRVSFLSARTRTVVLRESLSDRVGAARLVQKLRVDRFGDLRKTAFLSHLYIKTIILPRQARDKHRENSKKDAVFRTAAALARYFVVSSAGLPSSSVMFANAR